MQKGRNVSGFGDDDKHISTSMKCPGDGRRRVDGWQQCGGLRYVFLFSFSSFFSYFFFFYFFPSFIWLFLPFSFLLPFFFFFIFPSFLYLFIYFLLLFLPLFFLFFFFLLFFHFSFFSFGPMEALASLALGPPLGFRSSSAFRATHNPFSVSSTFINRGATF